MYQLVTFILLATSIFLHIIIIIINFIINIIINNILYYSIACNIYCQEMISNSSGESYLKDYLEPSTVLDIIKRMKLESLVMKIKVIDEV